eukprot:9479128-Pyramimonas_sp.AAC.1
MDFAVSALRYDSQRKLLTGSINNMVPHGEYRAIVRFVSRTSAVGLTGLGEYPGENWTDPLGRQLCGSQMSFSVVKKVCGQFQTPNEAGDACACAPGYQAATEVPSGGPTGSAPLTCRPCPIGYYKDGSTS